MPPHPSASRPWLVRIPKIFHSVAGPVLDGLGAVHTTPLGSDYFLIKTGTPEAIHESELAKFSSWNLPIDHSWPCHPRQMAGFIEKAALTLQCKFAERHPQGLFIGSLQPTSPDRYFRTLASNLRGRALQLFPDLTAASVEEQDPDAATLFGLVGKEGLFCGMQSPRDCNGFYPGGSKFIDHDSPDTISRAGAKVAEALHYLRLFRHPIPEGCHWLELGASPGGMTAELLAHHQRVTAVDRAALDRRLHGRAGLEFVHAVVADYQPAPSIRFDALLCDLNGPAAESMQQVIRLSKSLQPGGLIIFTLKLPRVDQVEAPCTLYRTVAAQAKTAHLHLFAKTHLTYNRHEFTLFFNTPA